MNIPIVLNVHDEYMQQMPLGWFEWIRSIQECPFAVEKKTGRVVEVLGVSSDLPSLTLRVPGETESFEQNAREFRAITPLEVLAYSAAQKETE